jgi:kynureninase
VPAGTITMHQNATVAQAVVGSCFSFEGRRRKILLQDLDFPSNHYLFEGFRRFGAEVVYIPLTIRSARPSTGWWRPSTTRRAWWRCRWCCSAAHACRTWRR